MSKRLELLWAGGFEEAEVFYEHYSSSLQYPPIVQGCCLYSRAAEGMGVASAMVNASRIVGGTLGVALFGSRVARASLVGGLHLAGYIYAGAFFLAAALSLSCMSTPSIGSSEQA